MEERLTGDDGCHPAKVMISAFKNQPQNTILNKCYVTEQLTGAGKFFLRSRNTMMASAQTGDKIGANTTLKNSSVHFPTMFHLTDKKNGNINTVKRVIIDR